MTDAGQPLADGWIGTLGSELPGDGVHDSPLAMEPVEFRRAAHLAADLAGAHHENLQHKPVYEPMPAEASQYLLELAIPEESMSTEQVLELFAQHVMPFDMGNQQPTFAAWVNPAAAPVGMLLDFLASVMNPTAAHGNHAANYVEQCVLRWMRELMGFPATTEGILVDGGSLANLHGLAAALQATCTKDGWDLRENGLHGIPARPLLYTSVETHNCVRKSTRLLGLGDPQFVAVDANRRIDLDALAAAVRADRAAGHRPFCVVASAGTVNTGVIDPLHELAEFCEQEDLWLHVDGAYGAFGALDPSVAAAYRGIERADSLALDPHKWLAAPNTCSCILVRDGEALRAAFGFDTPYLALETEGGFGAAKRFDVLGIYQTRRFLAAKIFGVLLQLGRDGLRDHIGRHIALARLMATMVDADPDLELVARGDLTIVCFRFAPPDLRDDDEYLNRLNREIVERVQIGGRAFVSATELDGRFVVRSCALHYALDETHVSTIIDEIRAVGRETLEERSAGKSGRYTRTLGASENAR